jgi:hypothetical protein
LFLQLFAKELNEKESKKKGGLEEANTVLIADYNFTMPGQLTVCFSAKSTFAAKHFRGKCLLSLPRSPQENLKNITLEKVERTTCEEVPTFFPRFLFSVVLPRYICTHRHGVLTPRCCD